MGSRRRTGQGSEKTLQLLELLRTRPPMIVYRLAVILGINNSEVEGKLTALASYGILCCEDEQGKISIFKDNPAIGINKRTEE
jgi:DNA-binding IclR family transcriptional regulator